MREVTYEDAMEFLHLLKENMREWSQYEDYEPEIEYIQEMLWQWCFGSNSKLVLRSMQ
jgi:hypothetical protein